MAEQNRLMVEVSSCSTDCQALVVRTVIHSILMAVADAVISASEVTDIRSFEGHVRFDILDSEDLGALERPRRWEKKSSLAEVWPLGDFRGTFGVIKRWTLSQATCRVEANELEACSRSTDWGGKENILCEIGVFCFLRSQAESCEHIVRSLAVFEHGPYIHLLLEECESMDLQEVLQAGSVDTDGFLWLWFGQVLGAVRYLHAHNIGHRDISLENFLLKNGNLKLTDLGQAVALRSVGGVELRYFRQCNKYYARAPECWLPCHPNKFLTVCSPRDIAPRGVAQVESTVSTIDGHRRLLASLRFARGADEGCVVAARPSGYLAAPSDMFACGFVLYMLLVKGAPWPHATLCCNRFDWAYKHGVDRLLESDLAELGRRRMVDSRAIKLVVGLLHFDPERRLTAEEAVQSPWLLRRGQAAADVVRAAATPKPATEKLLHQDICTDLVRPSFESDCIDSQQP